MSRALLLLLVVLILVPAPPAQADDSGCTSQGNLSSAAAVCKFDGDQLAQTISTAPTGTIYKTKIKCDVAAEANVCFNPALCPGPPSSLLVDVLKSTDGGATFTTVGITCVTEPPDGSPPVITPGLVAQQFQAIEWGESSLMIQPPGGRTLVNLKTNFYTDNAGPRTQAVTLLGQRVEIEATPTTWVWHHGDGTDQTTSQPGAAYPDLSITHTYLNADVTLTPSVDTTYAGRYRVNGGTWVAIPATVTIAGTAGALEVVPATPQLVAGD